MGQGDAKLPFPEEGRPVVAEVTLLETELAQLQQDLKEFRDKYLRLLADTENARKRLDRERSDIIKYAVQQLVVDLLNPLDHLEQALKASNGLSKEAQQWLFGFQMIATQFQDVLSHHGIQSYSSQGTLFDPDLHEAVEKVENEALPEGTIAQEFSKGYRLGDRIIRPAKVRVVTRPKAPSTASTS